jgi:acetyltransferase
MTGTLADLVQSRADLALISLPHEELVFALEVAGRIQCKSALIISTGVPPALAAELHAIARKHDMYLLGPNSLGFQRPRLHLNAGVAGKLAQTGSLALISQSGALTSAILDWAGMNGIGLSAVVSLGPNTAVDLAHTLDFLATDPATESIVIYMEGITDARRFLSALRGTANTKPVVIIKSGNAAASSRAAATHSGTMIGSDEVFDAALRRTGALRVSTFVQLFSAAKCLASRYRPVGPRLAIISNGGGPGVLAADQLGKLGLQLSQPGTEATSALAGELPPYATLTDLLDLSEEASGAHYAAAVRACAQDPNVDGLLVIYSPKLDGDPVAVAEGVLAAAKGLGKPLLTCWMGDERVAPARKRIAQSGLANFRTPEAAVDGFSNIAAFYQNQQLLQQTPPPLSQLAKPDLEGARRLVESVLAERRSVLTEMESKALLAAFHIPITATMPARSAAEAQLIAAQLGYPVALKIDSPDIPHKSEVQGVVLNLADAADLAAAYGDMLAHVRRLQPDARINGVTVQRMAGKRDGRELYIGVASDPLFGPVIGFGAGGTMVELINDRAVELPPLNQFLAQRLISRARVSGTLGEWRGAPAADQQAIEHILLRVSEMVCELPQLRELDINPLIVDRGGVLAVDARVVVGAAPTAAQRYDQLAIMPYPSDSSSVWPMRGGGEYTLRPVQPTDAEMLQALVRGLTEQSRYNRFASSLRELSVPMLARYTLIDYDREMALVAVLTNRVADEDGSFTETEQIIGVSRYIANPDRSSCEFSLLVDDKFSGQGLGTRLMLEIMEVAREKGLSEIVGLVLRKNRGMLKLMASLGFQARPYEDDPEFQLCSKEL